MTTIRWHTEGRRQPVLIGKDASGRRIPGGPYVVLEAGPDVARVPHDRLRPGLNHVAFHAGTRAELDALVATAPERGWSLLFGDRHPYAGGPDHYAAYLEDAQGFEVELVASDGPASGGPAPSTT